MLDRIKEDWRKLNIRPQTKEILGLLSSSKQDPLIRAIVLFGSEARGEASEDSDIDLAILSDTPLRVRDKMKILQAIPTELRGNASCQIVSLRPGSLLAHSYMQIGSDIKREGVLIYGNLP